MVESNIMRFVVLDTDTKGNKVAKPYLAVSINGSAFVNTEEIARKHRDFITGDLQIGAGSGS